MVYKYRSLVVPQQGCIFAIRPSIINIDKAGSNNDLFDRNYYNIMSYTGLYIPLICHRRNLPR